MQVSVNFTPELYQYIESSASSLGKSISEIITEKFQAEFDEEQQAKRELVKFLEPDIIAAKSGNVSKKTFREIVKEALNEATEVGQ